MAHSATDLIGAREGLAPAPDGPSASLAVAGDDGWLFGLGEEDVERLGRSRAPARAPALDGLADALEETARALHDLGVRHVVAVAPTKLAVHRDLAPRGLARTVGRWNAPALTRLARDRQHLDVLDLLPALRDATEHGPLFHARDEGMNARGAFFAQRALLKHSGLGREGLLPLPLERAAFAPTPVRPSGLEVVPVVEFADGRLVPRALPPAPEAEDAAGAPEAATLKALRMPAAAHLEIDGLPAPRVYENADADGVPRVVALGHPVVHAVAPWIAEAASRLVVLSTAVAPLEQIELELPHVVLHVLEERLLG